MIEAPKVTKVLTAGFCASVLVIAFDAAGTLFHWSGNSTMVMETIQLGTSVTNVPITGPTGGETFGATWWNWHKDANGNADALLLISNIMSGLATVKVDMSGATYTAFGTGLRDDGRGLTFDRNHSYPQSDPECQP
jgi:hypothetical protein